jgi:hypothetical protein
MKQVKPRRTAPETTVRSRRSETTDHLRTIRRLNGQVETLKAKVVDLQLRVDTSCPITTPALHQQVNLLGAENLTLKRLLKVERSKKVQLQN